MEVIVGFLLMAAMAVGVILSIAAYFLPIIVAVMRGHNQTVPIALVCIFLGWTFLGWVVALIWSFTNPTPAVVVQQFSPQQHPQQFPHQRQG